MDKKTKGARIGMVNFINTAPIYETWKKGHTPKNGRLWRLRLQP